MAAELLTDASRALDANANPFSGAKWYFYATGTLTPQNVYADADLGTSLGAVVTADAGGKFVPIYFNAALKYRGILENATGTTTIYDIDPINSGIFAQFSGSGGAALVGFLQAGTGAVARTAEAKARETVSIADYSGTPVAQIKAAAAELATRGGGVLFIPRGAYNLASAELVSPIALTSNVIVEGNGSTLTLTGTSVTGAVFQAVNRSNVEVRNLRCIGNSQANAYVNGGFFFYDQSAAATSANSGVRLRNLYLENFKATHWIYISNQSETYVLRDVLIENVEAVSVSGNYISTDIVYNASVICIQGGDYDAVDTAYVDNVVIRQIDFNARYMKTGIILYHSVRNVSMDVIRVVDAGVDAAFPDDSGCYAVQIYDKWGNGTGVKVTRAKVSARSCGFYVAGFRDVTIDGFDATGTTDTVSTTLPKGGVVFNGTRDYVLRNGRIHSCVIGLSVAGSSAGRTNALIENVLAYETVPQPLLLSPYAAFAMEGVTFRGCRFVGTARGADVRVSTAETLTLNDLTVSNCHFEATAAFGAGSYGFDAYALNAAHTSANWRFEGCTFIGADVGVRIRSMSGRLTMRGCRAPCTGQADAFQLSSSTALDLRDVEGVAGSGGTAFGLTSCTGVINNARSISAATPVSGLGSAKPTHSGAKGDFVQAVNFTAASAGDAQTQIIGWRCEGSTTWRPVVETVNAA